MKKTPLLQTFAVFILALLFSANAAYSAQQLEEYSGANKTFTLPDFKGNKRSLHDYSGKVVLVNFWASWCPPCIYEMPELKKLKKHFADKPFEVIAVNVGEKKYKVRKFTKLISLDLPVVLDTSSEVYDEWQVKTLPTSFLIDSKGDIRYMVRGNPGWENEHSLNIIQSMLP